VLVYSLLEQMVIIDYMMYYIFSVVYYTMMDTGDIIESDISQVKTITLDIPINNLRIALKYAPIFYLHSNELFLPVAFDFVLDKVNVVGDTLEMKEKLNSTDQILKWFKGSKNSATIYAIYSNIDSNNWSVHYYLFFAYNRGKKVLGIEVGNHVGDWEYIKISFRGKIPTSIEGSYHGKKESTIWGSTNVTYSGNHPVFYCAKGSHGMHPKIGNIKYLSDLLFFLTDEKNAGTKILGYENVIFLTGSNALGSDRAINNYGENVTLDSIDGRPWTNYTYFGHSAMGKIKILKYTLYKLSGYNRIPLSRFR